MSDTVNSAGTLETRADAGKGTARLWLDAIDLASREEDGWRKNAAEAVQDYRDGKRAASDGAARKTRRFNILFSNTETLAPAIYNSAPIPDVRRRFGDDDDDGRVASQVIERSLAYCVDEGDDIGDVQDAVVKDVLLAGRGFGRVKYIPHMDPTGTQVVHQEVYACTVAWDDFRHGPAKTWRDVPWIAFRHHMTREEVTKLSPKVGPRIELTATVSGLGANENGTMKDGRQPPDLFKRAPVWEVWDKEKRQVVFVADAWPEDALAVVPDPLNLGNFWPIPKPVYAVMTTETLVPVEPYRLYKDQANELDLVTRRIASLTNSLRWRGAYVDPEMGDFLARFKDLADGEMAPLDNPAQILNGGSLDKAFWFMPIEQCAKVLEQLFTARDQIKQTIYEITGISDILRGASQANETATAQQIKTQWGSLRVQKLQKEVARHARDLLRIMAEIIAEKFDPAVISMMSGIQVTPQVMALLKDDKMRRFRIEIETDSTIREDTQRAQQNAGAFVQGFGSFIQAVGPAVQAGAMPMPVVAAMIKSFSRTFKLGRAVEDAIDAIPSQAPNPNQGAEQAAAAQAQADAQHKQAELQQSGQIEMAKLQQQGQIEGAKLQLEQQKHTDTMALEQAKLQQAQQQAEQQGALAQQQHADTIGLEQQKHADTHGLERDRMNVEADQFGASHSLAARDVAVKERPAEAQEQEGNAIVDGLGKIADAATKQAEASAKAAEAMEAAATMMVQAAKGLAAPRRIVRGPDGRATGVEAIQ